MSLNDPAGLIERIPELEALAADPKIRKAIESGDPFKVYRALAWAKLFRRLPEHQETLKTLVRHRRLFAKPLNGSPALGSINGMGFSFVGKSEAEPDGTFIAKHAFVFFFFIPIVPLRSYLVEKVGSSLFSSQWKIYARVPSGTFGWLYSRAIASLVLVSIVMGIFGSIERSRTQDVYVVNGFDVPVNVVLDGKQRTVAPNGHERIHVNAGPVKGSATAKGLTVDTFDQQVASSSSTSVWNVAGAAPVFREEVTYTKENAASDTSTPDETIYCGQKFFEVAGVRDEFTPPPQTVRMGKHEDHVNRVHLDIAKSDTMPGYVGCMNYLSSKKQGKLAAGFMEKAAELKGWDGETTGIAMVAAAENSNAEAARVAHRALDAKPDDPALRKLVADIDAMVGKKQN